MIAKLLVTSVLRQIIHSFVISSNEIIIFLYNNSWWTYLSFQPVTQRLWYVLSCMWDDVIKDPLLLIEKCSPGSGLSQKKICAHFNERNLAQFGRSVEK